MLPTKRSERIADRTFYSGLAMTGIGVAVLAAPTWIEAWRNDWLLLSPVPGFFILITAAVLDNYRWRSWRTTCRDTLRACPEREAKDG